MIEIYDYSSEIGIFYQDADVVLMTSASESFSNVVAESKIFARPLVMYEIPWLSLLHNGKGYIAVKQHQTEEAAKAIVKLLEDDILWEEYAQDAWLSIQESMHYDVAKEWKKMFETFQH